MLSNSMLHVHLLSVGGGFFSPGRSEKKKVSPSSDFILHLEILTSETTFHTRLIKYVAVVVIRVDGVISFHTPRLLSERSPRRQQGSVLETGHACRFAC